MKKKEFMASLSEANGYNFAILRLYPSFVVQITHIKRIAKERQRSIVLFNLSAEVLNYCLHEKRKVQIRQLSLLPYCLSGQSNLNSNFEFHFLDFNTAIQLEKSVTRL